MTRSGRRRLQLVAGAVAVAGTDLAAKAWADAALADRTVSAGLLDLRLAYNPGVAFSLGNSAPRALVMVFTAAITAVVAVLGWRIAPTGSRLVRLAAAAILGGAVANFADRAGDGVVTDYLHTGWWPTFNLADVAICLGAALFVLHTFRTSPSHTGHADRSSRPPVDTAG